MRVRIRIAAHTRVQASYGIIAATPVSFPPARPLARRAGVYIKYFLPPNGSGVIFVRGDGLLGSAVPTEGSLTAFSITGITGNTSPRIRKNNQVFLPIAERVPVYLVIGTTFEHSGVLEF